MDVLMGQLNGDLVLAKIRDNGSNAPMVMLSSVTDRALIKRCESQGNSGFIFLKQFRSIMVRKSSKIT